MKSFLLFVVACGAFFFWFKGWVTNGQMDLFIQEHSSPKVTPMVVRTVGNVYYHMFQNPKAASGYYQWFLRDFSNDNKAKEVYWDLGNVYEELHQKDLALEQYTILRSSYPATHEGQMALERYNRIRY